MDKKDCDSLAKLNYFRAARYDEAREDCINQGQILMAIAFAIRRNEAYKQYNRYRKAVKNPLRRIFL